MIPGISFDFNSLDINKIKNINNLYIKKSLNIHTVSSINNPVSSSLMFIKNLNDTIVSRIRDLNGCIIFIPEGTCFDSRIEENNLIIPTANPRLDFALVLRYILDLMPPSADYKLLANGSYLGQNVTVGKNSVIEPQVFIDHNVHIGDNCIIMSGCRIRSNSTIGTHTVLHENCIIGGQGFGVERDVVRCINVMLPHVGGILIGDHVEIGASSTIASGTIDPTEIEDQVKTDNHVHIAHNCKIKRGVLIGAAAVICGSVVIDEYSWIGPNTTVIDNKSIGRSAFIALGSVVLRNVNENEVVAGNPARQINEAGKSFK